MGKYTWKTRNESTYDYTLATEIEKKVEPGDQFVHPSGEVVVAVQGFQRRQTLGMQITSLMRRNILRDLIENYTYFSSYAWQVAGLSEAHKISFNMGILLCPLKEVDETENEFGPVSA